MTCTPADRLRWIADFLEVAGKSVAVIACVEGIEYSDEIHHAAQRDLRAIAKQLDTAGLQSVADRRDLCNCTSIGKALGVRVHRHTSLVVIRLSGLLDRSTRLTLLSRFDELLGNGDRNFLIDTVDVSIADASGMDALVFCQRRAKEAGGTVLWDELHLDSDSDGCIAAEVDRAY